MIKRLINWFCSLFQKKSKNTQSEHLIEIDFNNLYEPRKRKSRLYYNIHTDNVLDFEDHIYTVTPEFQENWIYIGDFD